MLFRSLEQAVKEKKKYPYLVDESGAWVQRKDVRYVQVMQGRGGGGMQLLNNDWLTVKGGKMGPEFGLGHPLGNAVDAPVMILKSCIGNRSLSWDLLPPGSERFEFVVKDKAGKEIANLIFGKVSLKKDPGNPLPNAVDGVPAGRYMLLPGGGPNNVVVVSDPFANVEARAGRFLAKNFFKADRIKTLTVGEGANQWKITRELEYSQWKFFTGAGQLDPSMAVAAVNALVPLPFSTPVKVVAPVPPFDTANVPASVIAPVVPVFGVSPVVPAEKLVTPPVDAAHVAVVPLDVST